MSGPTTLTGLLTISAGTASEWAGTTKVVPAGVILYESDTQKAKISDGTNVYSALPYWIGGLAALNLGNGVGNDGSGNLTIKVTDGSIVVGSGGISVDSTNVINPVTAHGSVSSGTVTLNRQASAVHSLTIAGALTLALQNFASGSYSDMVLKLTNGGSASITWPTINWVTATGVTTTSFATYGVTLQSAGVDNVAIWTYDGTNFYGKVIR